MASPHDEKDIERDNTADSINNVKLENTHIGNEKAFKGDDSDGAVQWTPKTITAAIVLCCLYAGSQIILYFVGGALSYIQEDLGATAHGSWLPVSNTLAYVYLIASGFNTIANVSIRITAVAPFVGYLQDLFGRREITLIGSIIIMVGIVLVGTAHGFAQAVAGMAIAGVGAGICELTSLAGYVSEQLS